MALSFVDKLIAEFDARAEPLDLLDVREAIFAAAQDQNLTAEQEGELQSEIAAVAFHIRPEEGGEWGTHFAPWSTGTRKDGSTVSEPDLAGLKGECIRIWADRAKRTSNPVLKARYADAVWDLERKLSPGTKRRYEFAQMAIDAYLQAVTRKQFRYEMQSANALGRAVSLAVSINDADRISDAIAATLKFAEEAEAQHVGHWILPFDNLFGKGYLPSAQTQRIIEQLEQRLEVCVRMHDPFAAEAAGERLMTAYRRGRDTGNIQRVLRSYGEVYFELAKRSNSTLAITWLQPIAAIYQQEGLKAEAERMRLYIEGRGSTVKDEMILSEIKVPFDLEEVEIYLDRVLDVENAHVALFRLAHHLLPKPDEIRNRMRRNAIEFPFQALFGKVIYGPDGLPFAEIGSADNDAEGRMIDAVTQDMGISSLFLTGGFQKAREKFQLTNATLLDSLFASPLFKEDRREFFEQGFAAFESGDFLKSIHVLVPQVENLLRELLKIMRIPSRRASMGTQSLLN